ncbi:MAG: polysaccharide biosynthesis C-terminal domain-containing protein [Gaiellaceae bacterium]
MTLNARSESNRAEQAGADALGAPDVGLKVIRGAGVRAGGYGLGMLLTAVASVLLLRHLGVVNFGRYATVTSLVAITGGLTEAGLTAVAGRDLTLRPRGEKRQRLLENLLGLRLVLTAVGVAAAIAFAAAASYGRVLVLGTALAGIGAILSAYQMTAALPLSIDLRIGRLTISELVKQAAMLVAFAIFVAVGAGLLPFFGAAIAVALVGIAVTPSLVGSEFTWRPTFDRAEWRTLIRETLPLSASVVFGVFYFRVLIVIMSLLASAVATGLYATSFRVVDILYGAVGLIATTALPVLTVAAADQGRLRYIFQRMTEGAVLGACLLVLLVAVLAKPVLGLLGGAQYRAAAPVLRIQLIAVIPVFVTYVWQLTLVSIRRQSLMVVSNGLALVVGLASAFALIPPYGAKGAAIAAVAAEGACTLCLVVVLRGEPDAPLPNFRFLWKPAIASAVGVGIGFSPWLPVAAAAAAAAVAYLGVLVLTKAVPNEVRDAVLSYRRPRNQKSPQP